MRAMRSHWKDQEAKGKSLLGLLVYRSRLLGSDPSLILWGGNTSTKDIARGILWVKGSGKMLRNARAADFCALDLHKLREAERRRGMTDEEMLAFLEKCALGPRGHRPSVETFLHAWLPFRVVDHTHPDKILSLTNTSRPRKLCEKVFGKELLFVPVVKSGFGLAKRLLREFSGNPDAKGAVLEKHGLIVWGEEDRAVYCRTLELVNRAEKFVRKKRRRKKAFGGRIVRPLPMKRRNDFLREFIPGIRKLLNRHGPRSVLFSDSRPVLEFVCSRLGFSCSQKGPSTPGHVIWTKRVPCFLRVKAGPLRTQGKKLAAQIERYAEGQRRYFRRYAKPGTRAIAPYPAIILIPGAGMLAAGTHLRDARLTGEIYEHTIRVMRDACFVDRYRSLSPRQAFAIEYWPLERKKLGTLPVSGKGPSNGLFSDTPLRQLFRSHICHICMPLKFELFF